jgi:putative hydrolase of the HAD superfamily
VQDAARPAALLLDALGTLVRLEPPAPRLRAELARRLGVEISEAQAGAALSAEISYYREHLDDGRDEAGLAALRDRCASVLRAALPSSERLRAADPDAVTSVLLAALRFTAFDDVRPALELARARGQRLVVVSNWDVSLVSVLDQVGLAPLLDGVLTSAQVGSRKPSPVIFERALELVGVAAADAIHVGDTLDEDVAGARAAGVEPVLLMRDRGSAPAGVRTITSLAEL